MFTNNIISHICECIHVISKILSRFVSTPIAQFFSISEDFNCYNVTINQSWETGNDSSDPLIPSSNTVLLDVR